MMKDRQMASRRPAQGRSCGWLGLVLAGLLALGTGCTKQARVKRHLARADDYFKAEQFEQAEKEYHLVYRLDPKLKQVYRQLGLLYYAEGRWLQAFNWLRYSACVEPGDLAVRPKLARLLVTSGFPAEARKLAFEVLQQQPANEEVLLLVGELGVLTSTNDLPTLVQRLESLPAAAQATYPWHVARGRLWLAARQFDKADAEFKQAANLAPKACEVFSAIADLHLLREDQKQAAAALKTAAELAPWRSQIRIRYAKFQLLTDGTAEAKKAVELVRQHAPDYLPAWVLLGQMAQAEANVAESRKLAEEIIDRDPANYEGLLLKGELLLSTGEGTNAVALFEQMATLYQDPTVRCRLAAAYDAIQDTPKAVANLNLALAADTNHIEATLYLAEIRIRNNEVPSAVEALLSLLKKNPAVPRAYTLLAQAYQQQNRLDLAIEQFRAAATRWPEHAGALTLLGTYLSLGKQYPEARQVLEKALKLAPGLLPALEQLVNIDLAENQNAAAIQRVTKELEAQPKEAGLWMLLASVHVEEALDRSISGQRVQPNTSVKLVVPARGNAEAAVKALNRALELKPDYGEAHLLLTRLDMAMSHPQQALDRLTAFTARFADPDVLQQLAELQEVLGKYEAAAATYEKLLKLKPKNAVALNNLACLYADTLGQAERAYPLAEQAQRLLPGNPGITDTLGWALYQKGEYDRALTLFQESTPKLAGLIKAQLHLGLTLYMLGQDDAARQALQQVVQASPDSPEAKEARRRIELLSIDPQTADASALAGLEKCVSETPADLVAQSRLAAIYERNGAYDKAIKSYEVILRRNTKSVPVLTRLIRLYTDRVPNPAKALELARQAHDLAPQDPELSKHLARLSLDQKPDYKWVLSLLQEAVRKLPNQPDLLFDLARANYGLGRVAEAEATMQAALKAGPFPQAEQARRFLSLVAAAKDPALTAQAGGQAAEVLKTEPNDIPALMVSAVLARQQGKAAEAKALLEKICALNPEFAPATRELALLCAEQLKDDNRAYDLALKVREAYPDDPQLARALGMVCYRRTDFNGAVRYLQEAAPKRTEDAELYFYLGMAHYRLKANPASKQALQKALALKVPGDLATQAQRVLAELK